jgi:pimeloyl-ACP methyl ester carboxylesterase
MVFYEAGQGTPLVFLHGIGGGASSWVWSFVAPAFVEGYRVIVPDWVGWGASEHPARFLMFDDYVAQLETLLERLDAPAIVVAQSLASGFAMALAERRPELVARFFFNSPTGGKDFGTDAFGPVARAILTPLAALPGINLAFYRLLFHRRGFIADWFRRFGFADPSAVTNEVIDSSLWSAQQPNAAYSALPFVTGKLRYDLAPYFARLAKPAAMLWGEQETQIGGNIRQRLAGLRPDVPLSLIANSKACPELEKPKAVIAVIRNAITTG